MNLSIIGTGYVGLVTGTCFAEMGNRVYCVDNDNEKIENLKKGIIPIYEPGLYDLVIQNYSNENLFFTMDINEAVEKSKICFIAVGTPMDKDGSADLKYVLSVAKSIGQYIGHDMILVNKSTVPVGTADKVKAVIQAEMSKRDVNHKVSVVSNPEFLKEGSAINDCMSPDRIVIGSDDEEATKAIKDLYAPFFRTRDRIITMDIRSAEMTKYASNAMLATRISFMNEISNICEKTGADVNKVRAGMGSDSRIGYSFLYAGCGYGGSCFPKDVQALIKTAREYGCESRILEKVEEVNQLQKQVLVNKIVHRFGEDLNGFTFALWGLAFKPNTCDMREAPSIVIINELIKRGANIKAFDPKAIDEAKRHLASPAIQYVNSKYTALSHADALILITEWKEFRSPDFDEIASRLNNKIIFDGRNQYSDELLEKLGFEYYRIGKHSIIEGNGESQSHPNNEI